MGVCWFLVDGKKRATGGEVGSSGRYDSALVQQTAEKRLATVRETWRPMKGLGGKSGREKGERPEILS